jgi:hypothetical protein
VRVVGIDFQRAILLRKHYRLPILSVLAADDIEKCLLSLKEMSFPYSVGFGHFCRIKQVSPRSVRAYRNKGHESLKGFADEMKHLRRRRIKQKLIQPLRLEQDRRRASSVAISFIYFLLHLLGIVFDASLLDVVESKFKVFAFRFQLLTGLGFSTFCADAIALLFCT